MRTGLLVLAALASSLVSPAAAAGGTVWLATVDYALTETLTRPTGGMTHRSEAVSADTKIASSGGRMFLAYVGRGLNETDVNQLSFSVPLAGGRDCKRQFDLAKRENFEMCVTVTRTAANAYEIDARNRYFGGSGRCPNVADSKAQCGSHDFDLQLTLDSASCSVRLVGYDLQVIRADGTRDVTRLDRVRGSDCKVMSSS
jgi:hypothetical protein